MKRLGHSCIAGFVLLGVVGIASAIPQLINYQGFLTDDAGIPVADGDYQLTFGIYNVESGGSALWSETHSYVPVTGGLFNVILGSGMTALDLPFDTDYWLGVQIAAEPELPRIRLTSVGYSYRADMADYASEANHAVDADHADHATNADNATNAGTVDGFNASGTPTPNYLFPLGGDSRFPASVLPTGLPPGPHAAEHCPGGGDEIPCFLLNTGPDTITTSGPHAALSGINSVGHGLEGTATSGGSGVVGYGGTGNGVFGAIGHNDNQYAAVSGYCAGAANGVKGRAEDGAGVYGESRNGPAFQGWSSLGHGLHMAYSGQNGVKIDSTGGTYTGVYMVRPKGYGVGIDSCHSGVAVANARFAGVEIWNAGSDGYYVGNAGYNGFRANYTGSDGLYLYNAGGNGVCVNYSDSNGVHVDSADGYGVIGRSNLKSGGGFETATPGYYALYARAAGGLSTNGGLIVYGYANATGGFSAMLSESKGHVGHSLMSADVEVVASGSGRLVDGSAVVEFEELFQDAVSSEVPLKITVTPRGEWSGLYVAESSEGSFVVKTGAGAESVGFDWMAIGRKRGSEVRPARLVQELEEWTNRPVEVKTHGRTTERTE